MSAREFYSKKNALDISVWDKEYLVTVFDKVTLFRRSALNLKKHSR